MLLNYLSDDNILVMEASNKTLFKALATQEGPRIYGNITMIKTSYFKLN